MNAHDHHVETIRNRYGLESRAILADFKRAREQERDREEYEQSRGSAAVVAWLVGVGLVMIFLALAALWGA